MGSLFQIVYTSTAAENFGRLELLDMLAGSVRRNKKAGITGLLLFKDGCFMQALEGEEPAVKALFAKICRDPRHHHVIPLLQEPIEKRYFPDFAMAFRDLDTLGLQDLPGYSEFLNTPLNGDLLKNDIPKCQRLLLYFKKNIR
jgi:Sensors of blue-light using FAD